MLKRAVSEVFDEKITELKLNLIPYADDEEMQEIDNIFEEPENYQNQEFDEVVF